MAPVMTRKIPSITPRELQLCALVAEGYSNKEIAIELKLTLNTVKAYIGRIFLKKGCRNRAALVALYVQGASALPTRANHSPDPPRGGRKAKK
jgi:DNA-binding CsgD family transcriptional regulator